MISLKSSSAAEIGSVSAFQWSTSEQVWPHDKTDAGETLYAKQIDMGNPATTNSLKWVAHGISGYGFTHKIWAILENTDGADWPLPLANGATGTGLRTYGLFHSLTSVGIRMGDDRTAATVTAFLIYTRS